MSQNTPPSQGTCWNQLAIRPQVGSPCKAENPNPSAARISMMNPRYASSATQRFVADRGRGVMVGVRMPFSEAARVVAIGAPRVMQRTLHECCEFGQMIRKFSGHTAAVWPGVLAAR